MTPAEARAAYPSDICDLAEDLASALAAVAEARAHDAMSDFVRSTFDDTLRRVGRHDQAVTVTELAVKLQRTAVAA